MNTKTQGLNPDDWSRREWEDLSTPSPEATPSDFIWLVESGYVAKCPKYFHYKELVHKAQELERIAFLDDMQGVDGFNPNL